MDPLRTLFAQSQTMHMEKDTQYVFLLFSANPVVSGSGSLGVTPVRLFNPRLSLEARACARARAHVQQG